MNSKSTSPSPVWSARRRTGNGVYENLALRRGSLCPYFILDRQVHSYPLRLSGGWRTPNGLELSCPAAQATAHPLPHILAGRAPCLFRTPAGSAAASCWAARSLHLFSRLGPSRRPSAWVSPEQLLRDLQQSVCRWGLFITLHDRTL